ncbi:hypothetical protein BT67DRAFT_441514 [Trichocladium antarcticum]|uniref:Aminoglycoside phosphotransferase domain-containing protein n=1 Tax=Trichocladium antarcticum TaxID=1450529 RepID=A0AAN6ZE78_9PEZI|nr:hypothetical protein BT67DRAFT_441514 [Trichocladium antarcticum]
MGDCARNAWLRAALGSGCAFDGPEKALNRRDNGSSFISPRAQGGRVLCRPPRPQVLPHGKPIYQADHAPARVAEDEPYLGRNTLCLHPPQRYQNDVAIQQYLRERTNIPLPAFTQAFEDDGAMYLVSQFVEGIGMGELPKEDQQLVQKELHRHIETLKSLRSNSPGLPGISDDQLLEKDHPTTREI